MKIRKGSQPAFIQRVKLAAFLATFLPFLSPIPVLPQDSGSILWEISGNGLRKPSYLYGTIHIQDSRVFQFSKAMEKSFKKSKTFAMELLPDLSSGLMLMQKMKLDSGSLPDLYSPENYELISSYFKDSLGTPLSLFDAYKPFIPYSMVIQSKFKSDMEEALDLHLLKMARKQDKKTKGLETMDEQISALLVLTDTAQARMLLESIKEPGTETGSLDSLLTAYLAGDLNGLENLMKESNYGAEFEQALLRTRNHNMADRMIPIMKENPTFVAVGALHLPGQEGIIQLLRKKGYLVKPL